MKAGKPGNSARFALLCVLCMLVSGVATAHTSLGEFVQHRYSVAVSSKYIDLTVELTFNGEPAEAAREAMDADGDGVISRDERKACIAEWKKSGEELLRLKCNRADVPVAALYDPELDLKGDRGVNHHPFIVRLKFFASTPENLAPGEMIRIESALQLSTPALIALEVSGDAAAPLTIEPRNGDTLPALKTGNRAFEIQCPKFNRQSKVTQLLRESSTKSAGGE